MSFLSSSVLKRISVALWVCVILMIRFLPHSVLAETVRDMLTVAVAMVATWLYRLGNRRRVQERRVTAARAELNINQLSSERIILYLRSFKDDKKAAILPSTTRTDSDGFPTEVVTLDYTEEEQLNAVMGEFGHFITICRPDEALPHSGASRLRVGHEWQKHVQELMVKSLFVVIRLGATDGLLWELTTAVRYLEPCRLLLLVPFGEREYNKFCKKHQDMFPKSLPSYDEREKVGTLRGIICFQEDWTPELLTLKTSALYPPTHSLQSALRVALLPFIDRSNVPYQPLHLSTAVIFQWLLLGSMACWSWFVTISEFPNLSPWAIGLASAVSLTFIWIICAGMHAYYCLRSKFPGRS